MTSQLPEQELNVLKQIMEIEITYQRKRMKKFRRLVMIIILFFIVVITSTVLEGLIYPQLEPFNNMAFGALNLLAASVSIYGIKYAKLISDVRLRRKLIALNAGCLLLNLGLAVMNFIGII